MFRSNFRWLSIVAVVLIVSSHVNADPCGMVPPIYTGNVSPIARIGLQKTYVFHKDGMETFVIRPGFTGNVDEFGMLIPFPNPPALRKVPDDIFEHISKAVDPPEVVVDLSVQRFNGRALAMADGAVAESAMTFKSVTLDSVKVLKQEAVGMYEVAVLAAGSPKALKRWMDQHKYQYPKGMDDVTGDYIKEGWCFVAVKTKVGNKGAVDPQPGQRQVKPNLPQGSAFDGHVQGMGFRFKSEKLVVPMRLSAFNEGDTRNVVYLLTDSPRKIRSIPEEYVRRQISGQQLHDNLTKPLPLRIIGGTEADIPQYRRQNLAKERNPVPHNGLAKQLFASDLEAEKTGNMSLEQEESEKELLRIGEHFGLRGPDIDLDIRSALAESHKKTEAAGLGMLTGMTLTVVDGDFPREVIAKENLTFAEYEMPAERNTRELYEASKFAPGGKKEGVLQTGQIDWQRIDQQTARSHYQMRGLLIGLLGFSLIGICITCFGKRSATAATFLVLGLAASLASAAPMQDTELKTPDQMVEQLKDKTTSDAAIVAIVKYAGQNQQQHDEIVNRLGGVAKKDSELTRRGWAIAAMAAVGGQLSDEILLDIHADTKQEKLVRTLAAAARVSSTRTTNGLLEKASLIREFPALGRPIGMRLVEKMSGDGDIDAKKVIEVSNKVPVLQSALAPMIMAFGPAKIANVIYDADNNDQLRRSGAAYMASLAGQGESEAVSKVVLERLRFDPQASEVPWKGGALFVPGIKWEKETATELVDNLVRWHLWCDVKSDTASQQQIHNNIRGVGLSRVVGYQSPRWRDTATTTWLITWREVIGKEKLEALLEQQGLEDNVKYRATLTQVAPRRGRRGGVRPVPVRPAK